MRKQLRGVVTSDKSSKTRRVEIQRLVPHKQYGKFIKRRTVCHVHDENNESREGDVVTIEPCRPLSRHKSWRLVKIISRAEQVETTTGDATPGFRCARC